MMLKPKKMSGGDLAAFFRQLATHLGGGLSPADALRCIVEETPHRRVERLAEALAKAVAAGAPIERALQEQARRLGEVATARLAGAASVADVAAASADIAHFLELRGRLDQQEAYLSLWEKLTVAAAVILFAGILIFVIPSFKEVYIAFGSDLPGPTRALVALSDLLVGWWFVILALWAAFSTALERSRPFAEAWGRLLLKLPLIGRKERVVAAASVADSALFLARHGLPAHEAVRCAAADLDNAALRERWNACADSLESGESWANALAKSGVAPTSLVAHARQMQAESPDGLSPVVAIARDAATLHLATYSGWISRLVSIAIGVAVALMVIGIYLPIFRLGSVVG